MREPGYIKKTKTLRERLGLFLLFLLTSTQPLFNVSCAEELEVRQLVTFSSIENPHHTAHGCLFDQQRDKTPTAVSITSLDRDRQHLKRSQNLAAVVSFYSLSSPYAPNLIKFFQAILFDSSWHLFKLITVLRTTVIIV